MAVGCGCRHYRWRTLSPYGPRGIGAGEAAWSDSRQSLCLCLGRSSCLERQQALSSAPGRARAARHSSCCWSSSGCGVRWVIYGLHRPRERRGSPPRGSAVPDGLPELRQPALAVAAQGEHLVPGDYSDGSRCHRTGRCTARSGAEHHRAGSAAVAGLAAGRRPRTPRLPSCAAHPAGRATGTPRARRGRVWCGVGSSPSRR